MVGIFSMLVLKDFQSILFSGFNDEIHCCGGNSEIVNTFM